MFFVITAFCCWLAWEINWIHRRQAALKRFEPHTFAIITRESELAKPLGEKWFLPGDHLKEIPIWRRLMGDESIGWIIFKRDAPQQDVELAEELFPETYVARNP